MITHYFSKNAAMCSFIFWKLQCFRPRKFSSLSTRSLSYVIQSQWKHSYWQDAELHSLSQSIHYAKTILMWYFKPQIVKLSHHYFTGIVVSTWLLFWTTYSFFNKNYLWKTFPETAAKFLSDDTEDSYIYSFLVTLRGHSKKITIQFIEEAKVFWFYFLT